ncbi:hypothetical protein [Microbacterium arborescens]|uniref:hypothetical protein n=1 Tax=Microbacterium TaxID=33882 RepID=UPI00259FED1E|nr:hypothetical protein [Microbacterium arborescens]WJM14903.1 hypothetical protein QUC20_11525 [Microbacterium arborescens]
MKRIIFTSLSVLTLGAMLVSCGQGATVENSISDLTVDEAKQTAMSMERDLVSHLDPDRVVSVDQLQVGGFFRCGEEQVVQWTGHTEVVVTPDFDIEATVDRIVEEYSDREGFEVKRDVTSLGDPGVHIIGRYGAGYLLSPGVDDNVIEILSFSPCFTLPEGMSGVDEY